MNAAVFLAIAILLMTSGHVFKSLRWKLYISVYEKPNLSNLLTSLSVGHIINSLLPIRLGDFFRAFLGGRKLKNGYALSFATVIADLYVDLITVSAMFFGLAIIGKGGEQLQKVAHFYLIVFITVVSVLILTVTFKKQAKKIIKSVASLFNNQIEFTILYISYLSIASAKDIILKINKLKFVMFSIAMWMCYISSYLVFAEAVQKMGFHHTMSDVFTKLFSGGMFQIERALIPAWSLFILLPLCVCLLVSWLLRINAKDNDYVYKRTLPQMQKNDRLAFLKTYFNENNVDYINAYLEINSDVSVLEDYSAGSNASTILVIKDDGRLFFRKYAFGEDGKKLQEQIDWIENHQKNIPLPIIVDKKSSDKYAAYDMNSYAGVVGLFKYIHMAPVEKSWQILVHALDDIRSGVHTANKRSADADAIEKYISSKVEKNIDKIKNGGKYIHSLEQFDCIKVNGESLPTLDNYAEMLSRERLENIFKNDWYSDIHGDLTIENIVCIINDSEINQADYNGKCLPKDYYFIDPNSGNLHESPFLDYGKLLQSLHGSYEFLMMVKNVSVENDTVTYMTTVSNAYDTIYKLFRQYLKDHFTNEQVISIYYHEIIHWLRLMPYKIRKNEKLAVVFYTGLLKVLKDVREMENEE